MAHSRSFSFGISLIVVALLASALVFAQGVDAQTDDISAAIRVQLQADPNAANMPQEQFDALVAELAEAARKEGITADDIFWSSEGSSFAASNAGGDGECTGPAFLCMLNESFGFTGGSALPLLLFLSSAALLLVLWLMMKHHKSAVAMPNMRVANPPMPPRMPQQPPMAPPPPPRPPMGPPPTV